MRILIVSFLATSALMLGCGASYPVPTQALADAESAEHGASELGAAGDPQAQLHLKLAQEQMAEAKSAMTSGDNARANSLLVRSKADSEVALALVREQNAKGESAKAANQSNTQRTTNAIQGAE